jgi:Tol biopolymer transport system component
LLIALSHDGRRLAFVESTSVGADGKAALRILPVEGGEATTVLVAPSPKQGLELAGWSPDDKELLFVQKSPTAATDRELFRISVAGGVAHSTGLSANGMRDPRLSPDGRHVAFTTGTYTVENWVIKNFIPPLAPSKSGRSSRSGR